MSKVWEIEWDVDYGLRHPRDYITLHFQSDKKPTNLQVYTLYEKLIKKCQKEPWNIQPFSNEFVEKYFRVSEVKMSHWNTKIHYKTIQR